MTIMKMVLLGAIAAAMFAGCLDPSASTAGDGNVSTAQQEVTTCTSTCNPPTYNGISVSCMSNSTCTSSPGGVSCLQDDGSWATTSCTLSVCGDGFCDAGERAAGTCPADCPVCPAGTVDCCGDGSVCVSPVLCRKFQFELCS